MTQSCTWKREGADLFRQRHGGVLSYQRDLLVAQTLQHRLKHSTKASDTVTNHTVSKHHHWILKQHKGIKYNDKPHSFKTSSLACLNVSCPGEKFSNAEQRWTVFYTLCCITQTKLHGVKCNVKTNVWFTYKEMLLKSKWLKRWESWQPKFSNPLHVCRKEI